MHDMQACWTQIDPARLQVLVVTDINTPVVLHWGVRRSAQGEWLLPPAKLQPRGSTQASDIAAETPLKACNPMPAVNGVSKLVVTKSA